MYSVDVVKAKNEYDRMGSPTEDVIYDSAEEAVAAIPDFESSPTLQLTRGRACSLLDRAAVSALTPGAGPHTKTRVSPREGAGMFRIECHRDVYDRQLVCRATGATPELACDAFVRTLEGAKANPTSQRGRWGEPLPVCDDVKNLRESLLSHGTARFGLSPAYTALLIPAAGKGRLTNHDPLSDYIASVEMNVKRELASRYRTDPLEYWDTLKDISAEGHEAQIVTRWKLLDMMQLCDISGVNVRLNRDGSVAGYYLPLNRRTALLELVSGLATDHSGRPVCD